MHRNELPHRLPPALCACFLLSFIALGGSAQGRSEAGTQDTAQSTSFDHPKNLGKIAFFVESTHGLQIARCSSLDCFDAGENAALAEQYCDTDSFPDGCLRRWQDQSDYQPLLRFEPPEWVHGRDFGQDDHDKPGVVLDCLNGHPCIRGGRGVVQELSLETEPKQEVGPLMEDFSIFLLARPIQQSSDFVYFGFAGTELIHLAKTDALKLRIDFRRPTVITPPSSVSLGEWHLIEIHRDLSNAVRVFVDGWDRTEGAPELPGKMFFRFLLSVSRGRAMHGDVAAMLIYESSLSSHRRQQVRDYFQTIYGVSLGDGSPPPLEGAKVDLEHKLLLHWPLDDGTCESEPPRGPRGQGTPSCDEGGLKPVEGHLDRALRFGGGRHALRSRPPHADLDRLFRVSVSAWIRPDLKPPANKSGGWRSIVDKRDAEDDGWDLYLTPDHRAFLRVDDWVLKGDSILNGDTWHHVAGVYDGDQMRLYVDGRLDGSRWIGQKVSLGTSAPLWVGHSFQDDNSSFVGSIDEVRVYGRALNALEVQALAQSQKH